MGTSMASVAFRRGEKTDWDAVKPQIRSMFEGIEGLVSNLDEQAAGYAIVSPYGDKGMFLSELPGKISALTGDYVVMCVCVDSDFALMELYHDGKLLEECTVGEIYGEFEEFCCTNKADMRLWKPLLQDAGDMDTLSDAMYGEEIFVEDQLRVISRVTGLPIFDDEMVGGEA